MRLHVDLNVCVRGVGVFVLCMCLLLKCILSLLDHFIPSQLQAAALCSSTEKLQLD